MDDLNHLFRRQQQERSLAASSTSDAARRVHERLAALYEGEIRRMTAGRIDISPPVALS